MVKGGENPPPYPKPHSSLPPCFAAGRGHRITTVFRALFFWVGLTAAGALGATNEDRFVVAAMHLTDQPNYSWISTIVDDARTYEVTGRTTRGGFTRVKTPVVNAIRRRLGQGVTDPEVDAIFKGNVKCVLNTDDGWKTLDELPRPDIRGPDVVVPASSSPGIINKPPKPRRDEVEVGPYSNLQLAISHPHEELGVLVVNHADLKIDGDIATGTISDVGAQLLLVHDGQTEITPLRATGTFKLWIRGGTVTRYQLTLEGTLAIETPVGRREINVHQKMDTAINAVGITKFEVPEEAKRKLGGP
jgi:hypothetical protein